MKDLTIKLNDLLKINHDDLCKFKLHLAAYNGNEQPLDVFARDFNEWIGWNTWRGKKNDFTRDYIFSLIPNYHKTDKYIFGGVFKITERYDDWEDTEVGYAVEVVEEFVPFIGRLEIEFHRYAGMRGRAFYLEGYIDDLIVTQIFEKSYQGVDVRGYDNICLDFVTLEMIVTNDKQDWKVALENMKGIYVIVDKSNGKKYIGSAYGESGIWARWKTYVYSEGHGYNDELVELIAKNGADYARNNFQLAIIELLSMKADDDFVIHRESFWKNVLQTRGEFGYNKN
jgi:hypothetical protein